MSLDCVIPLCSCKLYLLFIHSQGSLILHDVPRLPDEIISPLDIDDEGIVDTILDLEEKSMSSLSPQDNSNNPSKKSSSVSANYAHIPDHEMQNAFYDTSQEQDLWISPDADDINLDSEGTYDAFDEQNGEEIVSPSLAAYASLALSNTDAVCSAAENQATPTKPEHMTLLYISPIKQTPLTGSNPTLSSAFMNQTDLIKSTKDGSSDMSFASPLSTSSIINSLAQPYIIDVDDIKDVTEIGYCKDKEQMSGFDMGRGDMDLWDLEQLELMTELNSSLDELIDREVMLCSPKMMPRKIGAEHQSMEVPSGDVFLKVSKI